MVNKLIKNKEIIKEKERLQNIFEDIDENKRDFVSHQIDNLAWLNIASKELMDSIDRDGTKCEYNNGGGQGGVKDNPDIKTLIAYQKNVTSITKQLLELVPKKSKSKFMEFLDEN